MANGNGDADCRQCRREGVKLFLKGGKCYLAKCPVAKRATAPGQHGNQKKKVSEYGGQLREKMKVRRFYGILEKQFRRYFALAVKSKGKTGEVLLQLLERRLDNIVYRAGLAASRSQARQMVLHGHFLLNGKKVNIPSCLVKVNDAISVTEKARGLTGFKDIVESAGSRPVPNWMEYNTENLTCRIIALPTRDDVDLQVKEHLIVELYSK